jgi:hypothetical protein
MTERGTGKTTWSIGSLLYSYAPKLCITCSNCVIPRLGPLFRDHTTGDAVSGISRRITLQIVGLGMNY